MDWIAAARDIGIPFVMLAGVAMAMWKVGVWVGAEVVKPLRDRHFAFLGSLEETLKVIAECQKEISSRISELQCLGKREKLP